MALKLEKSNLNLYIGIRYCCEEKDVIWYYNLDWFTFYFTCMGDTFIWASLHVDVIAPIVIWYWYLIVVKETVRNILTGCAIGEELFIRGRIKHARYFPHSYEWTIYHKKLTANGEDFAEESFIRGTLLSKILTVCAGLNVGHTILQV